MMGIPPNSNLFTLFRPPPTQKLVLFSLLLFLRRSIPAYHEINRNEGGRWGLPKLSNISIFTTCLYSTVYPLTFWIPSHTTSIYYNVIPVMPPARVREGQYGKFLNPVCVCTTAAASTKRNRDSQSKKRAKKGGM